MFPLSLDQERLIQWQQNGFAHRNNRAIGMMRSPSGFEARVASFMAREEIDILACCEPCESGFSWGSCDCCQSALGGDRFQMVGALAGSLRTAVEFTVCTDCHYYAAYGCLDDETMLSLDEEVAAWTAPLAAARSASAHLASTAAPGTAGIALQAPPNGSRCPSLLQPVIGASQARTAHRSMS